MPGIGTGNGTGRLRGRARSVRKGPEKGPLSPDPSRTGKQPGNHNSHQLPTATALRLVNRRTMAAIVGRSRMAPTMSWGSPKKPGQKIDCIGEDAETGSLDHLGVRKIQRKRKIAPATCHRITGPSQIPSSASLAKASATAFSSLGTCSSRCGIIARSLFASR